MKKAEEKVVTLQEEIENCKASKEKLSAEFDELGKKGIEVVAKRDEAMVIINQDLFSLMTFFCKWLFAILKFWLLQYWS